MMPAPSGCADLTGATRYRDGWFGKLILQVEENYRVGHRGRPRAGGIEFSNLTRWRDAEPRDLRMIDWITNRPTTPPPNPKRK